MNRNASIDRMSSGSGRNAAAATARPWLPMPEIDSHGRPHDAEEMELLNEVYANLTIESIQDHPTSAIPSRFNFQSNSNGLKFDSAKNYHAHSSGDGTNTMPVKPKLHSPSKPRIHSPNSTSPSRMVLEQRDDDGCVNASEVDGNIMENESLVHPIDTIHQLGSQLHSLRQQLRSMTGSKRNDQSEHFGGASESISLSKNEFDGLGRSLDAAYREINQLQHQIKRSSAFSHSPQSSHAPHATTVSSQISHPSTSTGFSLFSSNSRKKPLGPSQQPSNVSTQQHSVHHPPASRHPPSTKLKQSKFLSSLPHNPPLSDSNWEQEAEWIKIEQRLSQWLGDVETRIVDRVVAHLETRTSRSKPLKTSMRPLRSYLAPTFSSSNRQRV